MIHGNFLAPNRLTVADAVDDGAHFIADRCLWKNVIVLTGELRRVFVERIVVVVVVIVATCTAGLSTDDDFFPKAAATMAG